MKALKYQIAFIFTVDDGNGTEHSKRKNTSSIYIVSDSRDSAIMQATMKFMKEHISVCSNYTYCLNVEDINIYYVEELHN